MPSPPPLSGDRCSLSGPAGRDIWPLSLAQAFCGTKAAGAAQECPLGWHRLWCTANESPPSLLSFPSPPPLPAHALLGLLHPQNHDCSILDLQPTQKTDRKAASFPPGPNVPCIASQLQRTGSCYWCGGQQQRRARGPAHQLLLGDKWLQGHGRRKEGRSGRIKAGPGGQNLCPLGKG